MYIDASQNDYADTIAAPYSVRPFRIPSVSTPLEWKEINMKLDPSRYTIGNIQERLKKKGELFEKLYNPAIIKKNNAVLERL